MDKPAIHQQIFRVLDLYDMKWQMLLLLNEKEQEGGNMHRQIMSETVKHGTRMFLRKFVVDDQRREKQLQVLRDLALDNPFLFHEMVVRESLSYVSWIPILAEGIAQTSPLSRRIFCCILIQQLHKYSA